MVEGSKAWRDAWSDILHRQYLLAALFETVYKPVVGATEQHARRPPGETPHELMQRTTDLNTIYSELKEDLNVELQMIDKRLINPAIEARDALKPMKKTIKKREDKKVRT
jgi:amphiphysin